MSSPSELLRRGWLELRDPEVARGMWMALAQFMDQRPGTIWWTESPLLPGPLMLNITYELSPDHPLRVPWGWWLHFDGHHFSAFERGPDGE